MSRFYKISRDPEWNYGGKKFKLSRSRVDLFIQCPKCFYIDFKLNVTRPPMFPFSLNNAVDELFKREFDVYRAKGESHPLMKSYGLDAIPYEHDQLDKWRDAMRHGVEYFHEPTGLNVRGGIDDVWVNPNGELIVVDYKATSKKEEVNLDAEWQDGYKRQLEFYQWLFRRNGFKVSDTGYFVYANADSDKKAFDGKLEFDVTLLPYKGDDSWVEGTLMKIHKCLEGDTVPEASPDCDYCNYREAVEKILPKEKKNKSLF